VYRAVERGSRSRIRRNDLSATEPNIAFEQRLGCPVQLVNVAVPVDQSYGSITHLESVQSAVHRRRTKCPGQRGTRTQAPREIRQAGLVLKRKWTLFDPPLDGQAPNLVSARNFHAYEPSESVRGKKLLIVGMLLDDFQIDEVGVVDRASFQQKRYTGVALIS
jgi:hypothetical protein